VVGIEDEEEDDDLNFFKGTALGLGRRRVPSVALRLKREGIEGPPGGEWCLGVGVAFGFVFVFDFVLDSFLVSSRSVAQVDKSIF
jgi:hypothetical protein